MTAEIIPLFSRTPEYALGGLGLVINRITGEPEKGWRADITDGGRSARVKLTLNNVGFPDPISWHAVFHKGGTADDYLQQQDDVEGWITSVIKSFRIVSLECTFEARHLPEGMLMKLLVPVVQGTNPMDFTNICIREARLHCSTKKYGFERIRRIVAIPATGNFIEVFNVDRRY